MKKKQLLISLFSILSLNCCLKAQNFEEVGTDFFTAYQDGNFDRMAMFYDDNASFEDPTLMFFGMPSKTTGKKAIIAFFKSNMGDAYSNTEIKINHHYIVGNLAVYQIMYSSSIKASQFGGSSDQKIKVRVPMTTILKFNQSGKITEHKDFVDYADYMSQVTSQLKQGN